MDMLEWMEVGLGWAGGLGAIITLAALFYGIWRGLQRSAGRVVGQVPGLLRRPLFYVFASIIYFGLCFWMWQPLPLSLSPEARTAALVIGALAYFGGLGFVLWGRLALGKLYFVSSSMGAQLFAGHRLVTSGPYALVRHPMYLGILLTGLGGILLYRTWTLVFIALTGMGLVLRARREEQVLAAEFGLEWQDYRLRTPAFFPAFFAGRITKINRHREKRSPQGDSRMDIRQIYWHTEDHDGMEDDPFTYCPLCGKRLTHENVDHQPRKVCADCGYIHFRNPSPTVSLLIIQGDRVLLGKRSGEPGEERWATPSGYIEFNEDFLTAAAREAKEETGLDVGILSILNVTDSFFPPAQHFLNLYLLARVTGGQLQSGDDMGELRWFPLSGPFPNMAYQEDLDQLECYRQTDHPSLPAEQGDHKGSAF